MVDAAGQRPGPVRTAAGVGGLGGRAGARVGGDAGGVGGPVAAVVGAVTAGAIAESAVAAPVGGWVGGVDFAAASFGTEPVRLLHDLRWHAMQGSRGGHTTICHLLQVFGSLFAGDGRCSQLPLS